jgi:hydrogenase expression/formation protein HypE
MLIFAAPESAARAVEILKLNPLGTDAAIIGEVTGKGGGRISLETSSGGVRSVEMLSGEQLPRIC